MRSCSDAVGVPCVHIDFEHECSDTEWLPRLKGISVVINAVGIFREPAFQAYDAIHVRGPLALFRACARLGIPVIQISALGADEGATSPYHLSKRRADDGLLALGTETVI